MSPISYKKNILLSTPYLFKCQLSDYLCLETRVNIRKSSKRCQRLIDSLPLRIEEVDISVWGLATIRYSEPKMGTHACLVYGTWPYALPLGQFDADESDGVEACFAREALEVIEMIFSNPNLKLENLKLTVPYVSSDEKYYKEILSSQADFLKQLKFMFSRLKHKINVQHVDLRGMLPLEDCEAFLSAIKTEKLESIRLAVEIQDELFDRISKQIKHIPAIFLPREIDRFPFDLFSNTKSFLIYLENFSETEFNQILESNLQRDNFETGQIMVNHEALQPWMDDFLVERKAVQDLTISDWTIATIEGPKFKNTVEVRGSCIVFRRYIGPNQEYPVQCWI